jgi:hypothetical protein
MKSRGVILAAIDAANAFLFIALAVTGAITRYVLPPGSGGRAGGHVGQTWLGLTRHGWGDVHFWMAAAFIVGITLHLLLHAGWIRAAFQKYVRHPIVRSFDSYCDRGHKRSPS